MTSQRSILFNSFTSLCGFYKCKSRVRLDSNNLYCHAFYILKMLHYDSCIHKHILHSNSWANFKFHLDQSSSELSCSKVSECTSRASPFIYSLIHHVKLFIIYAADSVSLRKQRKFQKTDENSNLKRTPWSESASELYRPSDRRLLVKWLPTFADRGCHVVSVTVPYGRILGFLHRSRYFSIK
jgi:hypothetical protein